MSGTLAFTIYNTVRHLQPNAYGFTIRRHLIDAHGRDVSIGQLYVELERLERDRYLRSEEGDPTPERGDRPKRFFFATGRPLPVPVEQRDFDADWALA